MQGPAEPKPGAGKQLRKQAGPLLKKAGAQLNKVRTLIESEAVVDRCILSSAMRLKRHIRNE